LRFGGEVDFSSAPDDIFGPWALERSRLDGVLSVLQRTDLGALGQRPGYEAASAYAVADGVATIPLNGMISKEPSWLQMILGGTALVSANAQLQAALTDPAVSGILLHVSSLGGSVWGVDDFAVTVKEANKVKPVYGRSRWRTWVFRPWPAADRLPRLLLHSIQAADARRRSPRERAKLASCI
jgi:hypothetical protein